MKEETLLDTIQLFIWTIKEEDIFSYANQAWADFLYLPKKHIINKNIHHLLGPREAQRSIFHNREAFSRKKPIKTEEWIKNGAGERRLLAITRTPKLDSNNDVEYVVCTAQDMTDHKKQRDKLQDEQRQVEAIHHVSLKIKDCQEEKSICQITVEAAENILSFPHIFLGLLEGTCINYQAVSPGLEEKNLPINDSIAGKTLQLGKPIIIHDLQKKKEIHPGEEPFQSAISIPIGHLGILMAFSCEPDAFSPTAIEMAEVLLSHTLAAINRIRGEKALLESEERNRALLDAVPDLMFLFNREGIFLDYRAADDKMLLLPPEEFLNKPLTQILPPHIAQITTEHIKEIFEEEGELQIFEYQEEIGGERKYFETRLVPCGEDRALAIVRDMSQRKKMEEDLHQRGTQLNAILQSTADGILAVDSQGKVLMANKKFLDMWQIPEKALKNGNDDDLIALVLQQLKDPRGFLKRVQSLYRTEEEDFDLIHFKDGRIYQRTSIPLIQDKKNMGRVWSFRDITEQKNTQKRLQETKWKVEKLHETALSMSKARTEKAIYQLIIESTVNILKFTLCTFALVEKNMLVVKAATKPTNRNISIIEGIAGKTYLTGQTILVDNVKEDRLARPSDDPYKALISTPVGDLGVFQVVSATEGIFSQEDIEMVELIANHAAEAIKRIRSEKSISYMSFHDSLTHLYNRTYLEQELKRLDTERQLPICIIMADINGLKLINDAYGHALGDELLIQAGKVLKRSCRQEDIIARWGGDEFVILLPQTTQREAQHICNRIMKESSSVFVESIPLSMGLGCACKEKNQVAIHDVLNKAEKRMYRNKLAESRSIRSAVLTSLKKTLEEKSHETEEHALRMQDLAMKMAEQKDLLQEEKSKLTLLVSLHDIGKIIISEEILNKPEQLSKEEWKSIIRHPETGYRIARSTEEIAHVSEEILTHHEHWNGSGYPQGLSGDNIPLLARIMAIIDAYDVMTNGRPYKGAISKEEALQELKECAGSQFDPQLVEIFVEMMQKEDLSE